MPISSKRLAALFLAATISSTGCLSVQIGKPPLCPQWSEEGKAQAREAIKQYPALELELGRWAIFCEGLQSMR